MYDFESDYTQWRENKLAHRIQQSQIEAVSIADPSILSQQELTKLSHLCQNDNFAIYRLDQPSHATKQASVQWQVNWVWYLWIKTYVPITTVFLPYKSWT